MLYMFVKLAGAFLFVRLILALDAAAHGADPGPRPSRAASIAARWSCSRRAAS